MDDQSQNSMMRHYACGHQSKNLVASHRRIDFSYFLGTGRNTTDYLSWLVIWSKFRLTASAATKSVDLLIEVSRLHYGFSNIPEPIIKFQACMWRLAASLVRRWHCKRELEFLDRLFVLVSCLQTEGSTTSTLTGSDGRLNRTDVFELYDDCFLGQSTLSFSHAISERSDE